MKHETQRPEESPRRAFMVRLAGCTAGLMVPRMSYGEDKTTKPVPSDRLGPLLLLRKLGSSGGGGHRHPGHEDVGRWALLWRKADV